MNLSFKSSGDLGDILFSLPAINALGGGSLFLSQSTSTRELMTPQRAKIIIPLLELQPCLKRVEMWRGQSVCYDLDYFREYWFAQPDRNVGTTIAEWHCRAFGVDPVEITKKWLHNIDGKKVAKVIINRTARQHGQCFDWKRVITYYKGHIAFVGLAGEHEAFVKEFGFVPFYKCKDGLELAQVIEGAKLFVGAQSFPEAIAEGLKKPKILEVPTLPCTSVFPRPDAQYVFNKAMWLPEV